MALVITSDSAGIPYSDLPSGAVVQTVTARNTTTASKVFDAYATFEQVPGGLSVSITPSAIGNKMLIAAHLCWGGWAAGTDVSALFRIYKYTGGLGSNKAGNYVPSGTPGTNSTNGVATGCYKYNQGNSDSSYDSDDILIADLSVTTLNTHDYMVWWACGYAPVTRALYWNRGMNTPSAQAYRPTHTCTLTVTEIKA